MALIVGRTYSNRWGQAGVYEGPTGFVYGDGSREGWFRYSPLGRGKYDESTMSETTPAAAGVAVGAVAPIGVEVHVGGDLTPSQQEIADLISRGERVMPVLDTGMVAGPSFPKLEPISDHTTLPVERSVMPEAGADLRDTGVATGGDIAQVGVAVVGLRSLIARLGPQLGAALARAIGPLGRAGARVGWNRLPGWAQQLLIFAGITAGADILIDTGPDDVGAIQLPGTSDVSLGGIAAPGVTVVGGWTANGVRFYRLSDGRIAVQNKVGRWKVWRPKKPIVLYSNGARDIPTFLKADAALNRQSKRLKKALDRRSPRKSTKKSTIIEVDGATAHRIR